ncbi:hypothetical protein BDZ97DRAFT_1971178 [Flammula alnicola]|nr:hypothetical protein BDZ97DRAFT_1971178 [Flammula alnicola]
MFSASRKLIVPLFVYLSLLLATAECHDGPLHLRDHANLNMKRLMKKRSPFPADGPAALPSVVVGAGVIPTLPSSSSESASSTVSSQSTTSVSATSASVSATSASVSASDSKSVTTSASQSSSSSSTSSTVSTTSATTTAQTTEILNLTNAPVAPVSTVVPTITHTASVDAESTTPVSAPVAAVAAATKTKSTTLTVLIAVAASVGGIAIFWTIFRKWKLSSSKKFDERLNPIDWQPTAGEDGVIPTHRRVPSGSSSFHSGSGHNHTTLVGYGTVMHTRGAPRY